MYGFGYVKAADDYKKVSCTFEVKDEKPTNLVTIYSLRKKIRSNACVCPTGLRFHYTIMGPFIGPQPKPMELSWCIID